MDTDDSDISAADQDQRSTQLGYTRPGPSAFPFKFIKQVEGNESGTAVQVEDVQLFLSNHQRVHCGRPTSRLTRAAMSRKHETALYGTPTIVPLDAENEYVRKRMLKMKSCPANITDDGFSPHKRRVDHGITTLITDEEKAAVKQRLLDISKGIQGRFGQSTRWDIFMVVLLAFTSTVTPYEACFMESGGFDALFWINRLVDIGFLLDMLRQFNTIIVEHADDMDGTIITDRWLITKHYLRGWFAIDVVSVLPVPFDILSAADAQAALSAGATTTAAAAAAEASSGRIKMLRFTRLFRLVKLARVVKAMKILSHLQAQSDLSFSFMSVAKQGLMVVILLHWNACLWFFAATISTSDPDGGGGGGTWIDIDGRGGGAAGGPVREMHHTSQYLRSLFNSVSILYGGTCADGFAPNTDVEFGVAIVLCSISAAFYGYALGAICAYFDAKDPATREYQQSVDSVNMFMSSERIPRPLKHRVREYFRHAKQVIRTRHFNDSLNLMSGTLRGEIVSQMHKGWLTKVRFLNASPPRERPTFLNEVARALELAMFAQTERLVVPGELCLNMYIVNWGLCGLLGRVLGNGKVVGEDLVLHRHHPSMRRHYACAALTFVQAYRLTSRDLNRILDRDDLAETREAVRKAALRVCFMRTLVLVAQSRALTEGEAAWEEAHEQQKQQQQQQQRAVAGGGQSRVQGEAAQIVVQSVSADEESSTSSTSTSRSSTTTNNSSSRGGPAASLVVSQKVVGAGGGGNSPATAAAARDFLGQLEALVAAAGGSGSSRGAAALAGMTVGQIGRAQALLAQVSASMGSQLESRFSNVSIEV